AGLFDRTTVQRIAQRFETLLRGIVEAPEEAVDVLPLLGATERHQLAVEWNDTAAEIPREPCLPGMFRLQTLRRPDAAAVVSGELTLSYGELDARSSRLAARLRQMGVGPEQAVGLCYDRCADWALGMLGILKAGGFYVPLDLEYPQERLELMIADTGMTVVLTRGELLRRLPGGGTGLRILDSGAETLPAEAWEGEASGGARLAYVLYTSGSTGRPKGIGIPHRAIARLVLGNRAGLTPGQRMAQASNMGFDAATYEVWGALLRGGTLLEIPRQTLLSLWKMPGELRRLGIDTLVQTSALFSQLAREQPDAFSALRELFVGGDALDPEAVRRVLENGGPRHLYNGYGPTECTTFAVWHRVTPESASREGVPLGRPIANTRVVLCDRHLQPVPLGTVGELCLGGGGLARGYPGRGDLTAERFVPSVLGDEPGGRLYRTGDLARWLPAGELVFLGRFDHQVKVRGFRVELGEIEAVLDHHPAVREAAVIAREEGATRTLLACVVPAAGDDDEPKHAGDGLIEELRRHLAARLPA
ncbi:MAG TPA: amino acid adenylation domain-containing protein, partial [Thermoanaerobaculia bacterium]